MTTIDDPADEADASSLAEHADGPSRRRRRRLLVVGGATALVVLTALAVAMVLQGRQVADDLGQARSHASALKQALISGDSEAATVHLRGLQRRATDADDALAAPWWGAAARLPVVGDDVAAVRTASDVVLQVADEAMPPIVDLARDGGLAAMQPEGGRVDLDALTRLESALDAARPVIADGAAELESIRTGHLLGRVADPVEQLRSELHTAATAAANAETALEVMPSMLGADGPRSYLFVSQNNAEIRATGGLPGAYVVLRADRGRLSLGPQGSGASLGPTPAPVVTLTDEERDLYGPKLATYFVNSNLTPDFPRTGRIARAIWERDGREQIDGVLSVDPIALRHLLAAIGPVTLEGGQRLAAGDVVADLLSEPYLREPDPAAQDAYFAAAARAVFDAISAGRGEPQRVIEAFVRGAREHRLLVWSVHEAEQSVIEPTAVSGALPKVATEVPEVGVYLNDATGAKLQYYLEHDVALEHVACADGVQTVRAAATLRSNAPADASELPPSVIGPGFGAPPGTMLMNVRVYGPVGGRIDAVRLDDRSLPVGAASHHGRPVAMVTVELAPGDEISLVADLRAGPDQTAPARALVTPGVVFDGEEIVAARGCG